MRNELSDEDKRFIRELLAWDTDRRGTEWLVCNVALVTAGLYMISAAVYTAAHLSDVVIMGVLVPGLIAGLFLVGVYLAGRKRVTERHRLAFILRKLTHAR